MEISLLTLLYIIASVTFIIGLKMLSHPESARNGNLVAATGMALAILGTIFLYRDEEGRKLHNYAWIFGGIAIGALIGTLAAKKSEDDCHAGDGKPFQWYGWRMCCTYFFS